VLCGVYTLSTQASTGDSMSDGIKLTVPREPGRADGSRLLPRSTDFKDGARDGAREDARTEGAREEAREDTPGFRGSRVTDGTREEAREDTPGFTEPLREMARAGSVTTDSSRWLSVMTMSWRPL
jgi:hypothetical protein